jgi:hypothetical protein
MDFRLWLGLGPARLRQAVSALYDPIRGGLSGTPCSEAIVRAMARGPSSAPFPEIAGTLTPPISNRDICPLAF